MIEDVLLFYLSREKVATVGSVWRRIDLQGCQIEMRSAVRLCGDNVEDKGLRSGSRSKRDVVVLAIDFS
jgi:hypothetical protein